MRRLRIICLVAILAVFVVIQTTAASRQNSRSREDKSWSRRTKTDGKPADSSSALSDERRTAADRSSWRSQNYYSGDGRNGSGKLGNLLGLKPRQNPKPETEKTPSYKPYYRSKTTKKPRTTTPEKRATTRVSVKTRGDSSAESAEKNQPSMANETVDEPQLALVPENINIPYDSQILEQRERPPPKFTENKNKTRKLPTGGGQGGVTSNKTDNDNSIAELTSQEIPQVNQTQSQGEGRSSRRHHVFANDERVQSVQYRHRPYRRKFSSSSNLNNHQRGRINQFAHGHRPPPPHLSSRNRYIFRSRYDDPNYPIRTHRRRWTLSNKNYYYSGHGIPGSHIRSRGARSEHHVVNNYYNNYYS